jgi:hypothetical protein
LAVLFALGALAADAEPALRLPAGELAGEYWDLVARFDSGHWLVAQTYVSNLGPGDRRAGAIGYLITPDGDARRFKRSEDPGAWQLTGGRLLDLHSIALDPVGPPRRFEVDKPEMAIDVVLREDAPRPPSPKRSSACSFEMIDAGTAAEVELRDGKAAPLASRGHVALTHRWSEGLEADCTLRRVELFAPVDEVALYFAETTAPSGAVTRWLVARRGERVLFAGDPRDARVQWEAGGEGFAPPASARAAVRGLSLDVRFGTTLASVDPTEQLGAAAQLLLQARTQPRIAWLRAPFEIALDADGVRQIITGDAVAKVSYLNPLPGGRQSSKVAVRAGEGTP